MRALILCIVVSLGLVTNVAAQDQKYDEPYRPQIHFSPQKNWTNDPNGLVYFEGEYHVFFQYNTFGDEWGHMSWGHAVSRDLLHWQELPVAIPEENGVMIFTGSIVIDHQNASQLCMPKKECMVAIYTGHSENPQGHLQNQNLAYSLDRGRTWVKYRNNPVLDLHRSDFRDPSVSWDEKQHRWVMAVSLPNEHKVRFYASSNLKDWKQLSDFGPVGDTAGDWECPDLLRIPAANKSGNIWALKVGLNPGAPQGGSGEQYFLGEFDGTTFKLSDEPGAQGWTNFGKDDYCAISFNNLPRGQQPILLGWMSNWQYAAKLPTSPWRGQMSLPRKLAYVHDKAGLALTQEPIVASLRGQSIAIPLSGSGAQSTEKDNDLVPPYELDLNFENPTEDVFGVRLHSDEQHYTEIGFDKTNKQFYIDRTHAGAMISEEFPSRTTAHIVASRPYNVRLIVDRSSVEAYAQDGTIAMTDLIFPANRKNRVEIFPPTKGSSELAGRMWKLKSIWRTGAESAATNARANSGLRKKAADK